VEVIPVPPPAVLERNLERIWIVAAPFEMVEAGGVEPPSEKRCDTKTTCLAQFSLVRPPRSEWARNAAG